MLILHLFFCGLDVKLLLTLNCIVLFYLFIHYLLILVFHFYYYLGLFFSSHLTFSCGLWTFKNCK